MSEKFEAADRRKLIQGLEAEVKRINRLENKGAMTAENAEKERAYQKMKIQRIKEGLDIEGNPKED